MNTCLTCHTCPSLIKNYIGEERLQFNACCGRYKVAFNGYTRPRVIKSKTGPMVPLTPPDWCPRNNGITQMIVTSEELVKETKKYLPVVTPKKEEETESNNYKTMTYYERKQKLLTLPKHIQWDDIEEGEVYVIPKILSQSRKVVKVIIKTENLIRCSEIDEFGKESQALSSIYPKDIDMVFITKVLRY